jgi:diadenosine tetraphosphate (Ap4A) HIT family hydrolase
VTPTACILCARIREMEAGNYPYYVGRMPTGYVVLGETQYYTGTTEFVSSVCVGELHELEPEFRDAYVRDMALVAEAIHRAFRPRRLNTELTGNTVPHLHWRFFPRGTGDPFPSDPVWLNYEFVRGLQAGAHEPKISELRELRERLADHLLEVTGRLGDQAPRFEAT